MRPLHGAVRRRRTSFVGPPSPSRWRRAVDTAGAYVELLKRGLLDLLNPTTYRAARQRDGSTLIEPGPSPRRTPARGR